MRLDVPDLSDAAVLGRLTTRPDLVTAIRTSTGARSSDVPFLLLPMRIETRFAQAEVPAAPSLTGQSTGEALADTVAGAAARLEGIAGGDHATVLPANWKARKQFKREVDPIVAAAQADLAAVAQQAVGEDGQGLLRDLAGGSPGDAAAVAEAVARLVRALLGARTALSRLRSDYHRRRLLALLDEVTGPATRLAAQAPARARAAAALGGAALDGVPGHRLTDSALAYDKLDALLADPRALTAAPGRLARARQLCTEIAAVPPQWKARLLVDAAVGGAPAELTEAIEALATTSESAGAAVRAGLTRVVDQLKVRVFLNDVAVQTHEKDLTQDELEAGAAFWSARASHGGDETAARAAWRALCAKHDPNRAAWIARQTEPKAPEGGGARDAAVTAVLEALKRLRLRLNRSPARRQAGERAGQSGRAGPRHATGTEPCPGRGDRANPRGGRHTAAATARCHRGVPGGRSRRAGRTAGGGGRDRSRGTPSRSGRFGQSGWRCGRRRHVPGCCRTGSSL